MEYLFGIAIAIVFSFAFLRKKKKEEVEEVEEAEEIKEVIKYDMVVSYNLEMEGKHRDELAHQEGLLNAKKDANAEMDPASDSAIEAGKALSQMEIDFKDSSDFVKERFGDWSEYCTRIKEDTLENDKESELYLADTLKLLNLALDELGETNPNDKAAFKEASEKLQKISNEHMKLKSSLESQLNLRAGFVEKIDQIMAAGKWPDSF